MTHSRNDVGRHRRHHDGGLKDGGLRVGLTATAAAVAAVSLLAGLPAMAAKGRAESSALSGTTNLVVNGGFESGTNGWRTNDKAVQLLDRATPGRDSKGAARLTTTVQSNAVLNDKVNTVNSTTKGATYQVSAWVKTNTPGLSGQVRLREVAAGGQVGSGVTSFDLADTAWHRVTLLYAAASSGSVLDLNVLGWDVRRGDALLVDDIALTSSAPVSPTASPTASATAKPTVSASSTPTATSTPTPTATATPTPTSTPTPTGCTFSVSRRGLPSCGVLFGAAVGGNTDPASRESQVNGTLGVRRTYYRADQVAGAITTVKADLAAGRLPWISFKLPYSWSEMASGSGDAWAKDLSTRLAAVPGPVWVAFHHEPETDGAMADWTRMQARLSPIMRTAPNVAFTIVLTGWHQFYGTNPDYHMDSLWPGDGLVDLVGYDIYNNYGVVKDGVMNTSFTELKSYYSKIAPWAAQHHVAWGVAESGYTDLAADKDAGWLQRAYTDMESYGGSALTYFDSQLNSAGSWALNTNIKLSAFGKVLAGSDKLN